MLDDVYTAVARDVGLEPFKNEETFLGQVRAAIAAFAPAGRAVTSTDVRMVERAGPPCALASAEVTPAKAAAQASASARFTIYARFCYDSEYPYLGYAALFSYQGRAPASGVHAAAMSYIDGVKAAR